MTIYSINTGTSANKGDGDSLRSAFHKINLNFTTLGSVADAVLAPPPALGDISITNATISTTVTNESIVIDPNGTGLVKFRNTAIQFDNGNEGRGGDANGHILYTKGAGSKVGLGVDGSNSSLRIVGDADLLGTLADFGIYNGVGGAWVSKLLLDHTGGFTAQGAVDLRSDLNVEGELRAAGGVIFADGSLQSSAVSKLTISHITSSTTVSNIILDIDTIRFDTESGFSLIDLGDGAVEVAMNSTFKYWDVDGQDTLIAEGLDHVEFIAGPGINITTNHGANPQSITFSATGGNASIGDMLVDSTLFYPSTSTLAVTLSSKDGTSAASFLTLPSLTDTVNPVILSSPNEVRITTETGSANPITISPNVDGYGPGYVVIGTNGTTSTAGLFAFSAGGGIDFWPNETIADLYSGSDAGTLDLYTSSNNNNISIRPDGTGQVVVTGNIVNRKSVVYSTSAPGNGVTANSGNFLATAVTLDIDKQIQKLAESDYYLPPGQEGQMMYFVPVTGADTTIRIWFEAYRSMMGGTAAVLNNSEWLPFSSSVVGNGPAYAIFTDNAWTTSHGFTS